MSIVYKRKFCCLWMIVDNPRFKNTAIETMSDFIFNGCVNKIHDAQSELVLE